ncbi:GDSL-type esterase/lipase family protein [Streptomyces capparidis]
MRPCLALAATLTVLLSTAAAHPSSAQGNAREKQEPAVVSLGDSYISGEGGRWQGNTPGPELPADDMRGTDRATVCGKETCHKDPTAVYGDSYASGCHRSDVAEIVSAPLATEAARINLACSGARTVHVLRSADGGMAFKGEKPQADQLADIATRYDVRAIQLSISGNDLSFGAVMEDCVRSFVLLGSPCKAEWDQPLRNRMRTQVPDRVKRVVDSVRAAMESAGYTRDDYVLALQSYPSPVPLAEDFRHPQGVSVASQRWQTGGCPLYDQDADWARGTLVPGIAGMLAKVARQKKTGYLDLQHALDGHEVCADAAHQPGPGRSLANPQPAATAEWVRFLSADLLGNPVQGKVQESFHPDSHGQRALGRCLAAYLARQEQADAPQRLECRNTPGKGPNGMYVRAPGQG